MDNTTDVVFGRETEIKRETDETRRGGYVDREREPPRSNTRESFRKRVRQIGVRLPGEGNSDSHGARQVHLIFTMIKMIRTSRMSLQNALSGHPTLSRSSGLEFDVWCFVVYRVERIQVEVQGLGLRLYRGTSLIRDRHPPRTQ